MGYAKTVARTLPDAEPHGLRDALAPPGPAARGSPRSLTVVPLIPDQRYYGETPGNVPAYAREWAGRVAVRERPEAGLFGEASLAGEVNRDSANRRRQRAQEQPGRL
jgi:hypothetical protein